MNIEYNLTFNNTEYILYFCSTQINLTISLEQVNETMYWNGIFDARYLEEITKKAGSFKTFEVFLKMLMSGLAKETENVLIDLLSYKDLEMMRNKKSNNTTSNSINESNSNVDLSTLNKKYLIISYTNEFEKVHFPLPISFVIQPEISLTLRTIERLKKANLKLMSNNNNNNINNSINNSISLSNTNRGISNSMSGVINIKDLEELRNENQNLKNKIKLLESHRKLGAVENDEFLRNYTGIKEEYDTYKEQAEEKIKLLAKTVEDLKMKINYNIEPNSQEDNENSSAAKVHRTDRLMKTISELEGKLEKAEEIVIKERKTAQQFIDEKNREVEKIKKDIFFMKENEKKLKVKINQLEKDLELANKKTNYSYNSKTKSVKSNYSYKSALKSSSSKSNYSKESTNSKASNPYEKFKGLYNKQYQPFNFFTKNRSGSKATSKVGSYVGSSKGSVYSGNSAGRSNASLNSNKKPPGSKFSVASNKNNINTLSGQNKSNLYNKNFSSGIGKNLYKPKISNVKSNIYGSGKTGLGYNKANLSSANNINNKGVYGKSTLNKPIGNSNKNILMDKQRILGENQTNQTIPREEIINKSLGLTGNLSNAGKDKENNITNPDEINARLGRIQQLLDTAKI